MRIYLATSWRNPYQPHVLNVLRAAGHMVYDFRNPAPGNTGFRWSDINADWQNWTFSEYREALKHDIAEQGFAHDMTALRECEGCVLLMPSGRSAALEAGWASGAGKRTVVLFPGRAWTPFVQPACGHTLRLNAACGACGDLDGCHWPGKSKRMVEPELMVKMLGYMTDSTSEMLRALT